MLCKYYSYLYIFPSYIKKLLFLIMVWKQLDRYVQENETRPPS